MQPLNLPHVDLSFKEINGKRVVFDILRKKYVILTPEEWVRQNFIHYLINQHNYPKALIKLETGVKYNELKGRSDIVVYNREGGIFMVVECKSTDVTLDNKVFEQAGRYNLRYKAIYLVITNGLRHYCCLIDHNTQKIQFLNGIPAFS